MNRLRRTLAGLAMGTAVAALGMPALATPSLSMASSLQATPDVSLRAELAASTLAANDLPNGFTFVGETFLTADQVAGDTLDATALDEAGFQTQYISVYENPDEKLRVRSYVSAWTDDAAAEAGFAIVEDEATVSPDAALTDAAASVGDEPRETTTGTYSDANGGTISTIDTTFRRGNLVAGVAVEKLDGSEVDATIAGQLAASLDKRVQAVQKGDSPAYADLALPVKVVSLASLGQDIQVGFLGPIEVERIYGLQGSVLDGVKASWVESILLGSSDAPGARVTIGVTTLEKDTDATAIVEHVEELAVSMTNQEDVDGASVEGAETVRAFRFTSPGAEDNALDSYRIIYAVGPTVTVIDVQAAPSDAVAADTANALAAAQVGCESGDSCDVPELPAELLGP
jgi:hypothetical protein